MRHMSKTKYVKWNHISVIGKALCSQQDAVLRLQSSGVMHPRQHNQPMPLIGYRDPQGVVDDPPCAAPQPD